MDPHDTPRQPCKAPERRLAAGIDVILSNENLRDIGDAIALTFVQTISLTQKVVSRRITQAGTLPCSAHITQAGTLSRRLERGACAVWQDIFELLPEYPRAMHIVRRSALRIALVRALVKAAQIVRRRGSGVGAAMSIGDLFDKAMLETAQARKDELHLAKPVKVNIPLSLKKFAASRVPNSWHLTLSRDAAGATWDLVVGSPWDPTLEGWGSPWDPTLEGTFEPPRPCTHASAP